jgi:sigma-54 specific flagellar transcriptional regulator A
MTELADVHLQHTGDSPLSRVLALAERVATSEANALVIGESGVGKQAVAFHIHRSSPCAGEPIFCLRCEGADEEALQRALFGEGRAPQDRGGPFASAHGGTLLLLEIAALAPQLQAALMNTLSLAESVDPLSKNRRIRVIATTVCDLARRARDGRFRRDLLDLLACDVRIPPLRERRSDISAIMRACWARVGGGRAMTSAALDLVRQQEWPGNARQLQAFAVRLAVMATRTIVDWLDVEAALGLPVRSPAVRASAVALACMEAGGGLDAAIGQVRALGLQGFLQGLEETLIDWALAEAGGTRKAAADLLRIKRTTLVEKLRRREGPSQQRSNLTLMAS